MVVQLACKICGSSKENFFLKCKDVEFREKTVELVQCVSCKAVFVKSKPTQKQLEAYYTQEYYNKPSLLLSIIQSLRSNSFKPLKAGNLLDVGCGAGHFLETMQKRGWNCTGTEVSESSKQFTEDLKRKGIQIQYGTLPTIFFPPQSFDLITFWHVVEHLPNPSNEIQYSSKLLKKNGLLFIAVPNIQSLSFAFWKCNWLHLDAPRHLNHFSPQTLRLLLEKNGFRILKISQYSFEFNPYGVLVSIYNWLGFDFNFLHKKIKGQRIKKNFRHWFLVFLTVILLPVLVPVSIILSYVFALLGRGDTIQVLAQKH